MSESIVTSIVSEPQTSTQEPIPSAPSIAEVNATLAKFGKACRSAADANYKLADIASEYVRQFLASSANAKRATAIDNLAEQWRLWDESSMSEPADKARRRLRDRVNMLLRCHATASLLSVPKDVAWGQLRELAPIVERNAETETYSVLPFVDDDVKALVADVVAEKIKRQDLATAVVNLVAKSARVKAENAAKERQAAQDKAKAESQADTTAKEVVETKSATVADLTQQVEQAPSPEAKAELTAKLADERDKLLKAQAERAKQLDAEIAAKAEQSRKENAEKEARQAAERAEAKAAEKAKRGKKEKVEQAEAPKAAEDPTPRGTNLLQSAKLGTAKDVAEMAVELITGADEPDDVLEHLLRTLKASREMSKVSARAIDAALVILARSASPSPVDIARSTANATNGTIAAVA